MNKICPSIGDVSPHTLYLNCLLLLKLTVEIFRGYSPCFGTLIARLRGFVKSVIVANDHHVLGVVKVEEQMIADLRTVLRVICANYR